MGLHRASSRDRGSFDPVVAESIKSLIIQGLAKRSDHRAFHIFSRHLPSAAVDYDLLFILDTN